MKSRNCNSFANFRHLDDILGDKLFENQNERIMDVVGMIPESDLRDPDWFKELVEQRLRQTRRWR